jgi:hypothetical protein
MNLPKLKLKLVDNWRQGWKWVSVWCMALSGAVLTSWQTLPDDWKAMLPQAFLQRYIGPLLLIGIIGRFIDQTKKAEE